MTQQPGTNVVSIFSPWREGGEDLPLRIALVGTYAPRQCGIASFTTDIREQLARHHPEIGVELYVLDNPRDDLAYDGPSAVIDAHSRDDYLAAARRINESGVDAVWLQHEYGIFGGLDGALVCDFVDRVAAPLVLTCHTVLRRPTERQEAILRHLVTRASRIMVMSHHARDLLIERYGAPGELTEVIPHGAPDRPFGREEQFKANLGLAGRNVLMTFGLLGPGKGLERVIEALPAIVARHPKAVYRIVGATHPNLVAEQGERYRDSLKALARDRGVEDHILWDDRFLETDELLDQLEACDIYITPYFNLQQATSGTLSYAVALGKAVISTPYLHARELLSDGAGVLIEPDSSEAIAAAVNVLLDDPVELDAIRQRAYARGRQTIWPEFAEATARLISRAVAPSGREIPFSATPGLSALFAMSDATGMLQHSDGIVPDRNHGYCLDDNARALMLMNLVEGVAPAERMKWSQVYASFVQHAWNPEANRFRNFMRFDRGWCEEIGSDDSNGRALWALGHTAAHSPDPDLRRWALRWFDRTGPAFLEIDSPRAIAFATLGAACVLRAGGGHPLADKLLDRGGTVLHRLLDVTRRPDWAWFEAVLAYDNPRLPQALIEAGALRARDDWTAAGLDSLRWIAGQQIAASGHFRAIGSETFGLSRTALPFDQQPLEAQAAVDAAVSAYAVSGDARWIEHAEAGYRWYFGANDRGVVLAEIASGRCRDGITPRGANENCGAESVLAFQLAHQSMLVLKRTGPAETTGSIREPTARTSGQSPAFTR